MLSRRKFVKLAAPALILPSRFARAAFSSAQTSNHVTGRYPVALDATETFPVDQFGDPCLIIGGAPQVGIEMLTASQIEQLLSTSAQMGFNAQWAIPADNVDQTSPETNLAGNSPFASAKSFTGFQTPYWNFVDYFMARALYWGQTVLLNIPFIGLSGGPGSGGYNSAFWNLPTATIQAWASFLVNRYGGFPNLIFLLGGDTDPNVAAAMAALDVLGVALKAIDSHLITQEATRILVGGSVAPNGGYSSVDAHVIAYGSVRSWLDFNWVYQTQPTVLSGAQRCYSQGKPCLLGEDPYELETSLGVPVTSLQVRGNGYLEILGGCTLGRLFGNGAIWSLNSVNGSSCCTSGTPTWQSQLSSVGSVGQQLMANYFRSRPFPKMVPDLTNVTMTSNSGGAGTAACTRASDGSWIGAYASQQNMTFDMSKITDAGSQVLARWYDPATGAVRAAGLFPNSGSQTFTVPSDLSDAVLDLVSPAAGFRPPGT